MGCKKCKKCKKTVGGGWIPPPGPYRHKKTDISDDKVRILFNTDMDPKLMLITDRINWHWYAVHHILFYTKIMFFLLQNYEMLFFSSYLYFLSYFRMSITPIYQECLSWYGELKHVIFLRDYSIQQYYNFSSSTIKEPSWIRVIFFLYFFWGGEIFLCAAKTSEKCLCSHHINK